MSCIEHPTKVSRLFASLAGVVVVAATLAPAATAQMPPSANTVRTAAAATDAWPRSFPTPEGTILFYQPQLDEWDGVKFDAHAAVAVEGKDSTKPPVYGVIWVSTRTEVDKDARKVTFLDMTIQKASFPSEPENADRYMAAMQKIVQAAGREHGGVALRSHVPVRRVTRDQVVGGRVGQGIAPLVPFGDGEGQVRIEHVGQRVEEAHPHMDRAGEPRLEVERRAHGETARGEPAQGDTVALRDPGGHEMVHARHQVAERGRLVFPARRAPARTVPGLRLRRLRDVAGSRLLRLPARTAGPRGRGGLRARAGRGRARTVLVRGRWRQRRRLGRLDQRHAPAVEAVGRDGAQQLQHSSGQRQAHGSPTISIEKESTKTHGRPRKAIPQGNLYNTQSAFQR